MSSGEFQTLLASQDGLTPEAIQKLVQFRELVLDESSRQNLTRLTEPKDFYEGHILDVLELLKSGLVGYPAMDLGSGAGVPGIIGAILGSGPWLLVESERRKAEFLDRACTELGLGDRARAVWGRAEVVLKKDRVESVVARAVGPVERIYGWLRPCSTWNNLVLLKGPAWQEEWAGFQDGHLRKELGLTGEHRYTVGPDKKTRVIVRVERQTSRTRR